MQHANPTGAAVTELELEVNSRQWWDQYFEHTWEQNRGRNQTRGFMRALIANLPDRELAYLLSTAASVLDWGCAMGDGVQILGETFPLARVAGLDFSMRAIEIARADYPPFEFIHTADGSIPHEFDVILTSNCLEHFTNPLDVATQHLERCNDLYIAMVPYNEQVLLEQHCARFTEETFPHQLGRFARLMACPIDLPSVYWPGQQLIVVYGSPSYIQRHADSAPSSDLTHQIEQLRRRLLANESTVLGEQCVEAEQNIHELWQLAQEKDQALLDVQRERQRLWQLAQEKDQALLDVQRNRQQLWQLAQEKDAALAEVRGLHSIVLDALRDAESKAVEERHRFLDQLAQLRQNLATADSERAQLNAQLSFVYSTRGWRWSVRYWQWRKQGIKGIALMALAAIGLLLALPFWVIFQVLHSVYHLTVPRKLRVAFWEYRWRLRHGKPATALAGSGAAHNAALVSASALMRDSYSLKCLKDIYIFSMVPYYDIGGGQRSAQLAKSFNRMGYAVHYVYAYEATDSGERDPFIPAVRHVHVKDLTPRDVVASLRGEPIFIFEAPHTDFEPYLDLAAKVHAKVIYEHIDNWETSLGSFFFSEEVFKKYLLQSDLLVATTQLLADRIVAFMQADGDLAARVNRVIYAANAVDNELFDPLREHSKPDDLVQGAPTLLYYGSLWGEWFHWDLIRNLALECPSCTINLIGDYTPIEAIVATMPANVRFLGPKKQPELPAYLAHSDFALLPFKNDDIGKYVSPLKIFEYIAMRKPVLATALPDIAGYPNLFISDDVRDWARVVRGDEHISVGRGQEFASANNWYARCNVLLDQVELETDDPALGQSISVIVLNRNNGKVITRCIDTLLQTRQRYDYEVIVVDNQSTDGSYETLQDRYAQEITLLRNSRNGCSSGRNLGIEHARGKLLLFVDSDQWVVSKRWLDAPLLVLAQNRHVGAVASSGGWFYPDKVGGPITAYLPHGGIEPAALFRTDIGYLATAGMLVRREALSGSKPFDEVYDPTCYEDTDLSLQIREQGFELAYCPYMNLHHLPHQTTQSGSDSHQSLMERNGSYFERKWRERNPKLLEYFLN